MAGVRRKPKSSGKYQGWFVDFKGDRKFFVGTKKKSETQHMAEKFEDEHRQVRLGYRPIPQRADKYRNIHIEKIIQQYLEWGKAQGGRGGKPWGKVHFRKRESHLIWWKEQLGLEVMADLDGILARAEDILRELQLKKRSGKTLQNYAESLNSFCIWSIKRGFLHSNPLHDLAPFDTTPLTIRRAMTEEEIMNLFLAAPVDRKLLYAVAFTTGLRAGELRSLTESHLDKDGCGLILNAEWTKNRKPGHQPLPSSLLSNLQEFADEEIASRLYEKFYKNCEDLDIPENPLLYVPSHPAREMDKDMKLAGIPKVTPAGKVDFHSCRVAFISYILEAGATVKEAQVLARHSTPILTMNTYARAKDSRLADLTEMVAERLLFQPASQALLAEGKIVHNLDFLEQMTDANTYDTDVKHKECALCVPKGVIQADEEKCKPLRNNDLHQFQGNGGGGNRTPVPRHFKKGVYMLSRFIESRQKTSQTTGLFFDQPVSFAL